MWRSSAELHAGPHIPGQPRGGIWSGPVLRGLATLHLDDSNLGQ
jgi:hypothetical protein